MTTDLSESFREFFQQIVEDSVRKVLDEKRQEKFNSCPYYTQNEAAERLGVSLATFYRLQKLNPQCFEAVKVGRKKLYTKKSVENFINKQHNTKTK